jgi:lysozyme family protein
MLLIPVRLLTLERTEGVYMTEYEEYKLCADKTLKIEGGYVNDAADAGGATKYGLSLNFLKKLADTDKNGFVDGDLNRDGVVDEKDIQLLTLDDYYRIMKQYFWDTIPMDRIPDIDVKWKLFDLSVHSSPLQSIKIFQEAVGAEPDGIIGNETLTLARQLTKDSLLISFSYQQLRFYNASIIHRPLNFKYMANWTWRANQQLQ